MGDASPGTVISRQEESGDSKVLAGMVLDDGYKVVVVIVVVDECDR